MANATETESSLTVCDACTMHPSDCSDLHTWYLSGSIVTMIGALFVICTYLTIARLRKHPSSLIFSRCIFDFLWGVYFFVIYFFDVEQLTCNESLCSNLGAFAYFTFSGSQGYFAAISWDLYLSIRNPFGKPDSHLKMIHSVILSVVVFLTFILYVTDNFAWREDMQICFIAAGDVYSQSINWVTSLTLYIPALLIILGSIGVGVYANFRLRRGLPDTYKLRMRVIRDGAFFSFFFTLYFLSAGISYFLIWLNSNDTASRTNGTPSHDSDWIYFIFAIIFGALGLVDLAIWGYSKFFQRRIAATRHDKAISFDDTTLYDSRASLSHEELDSRQSSLGAPKKAKAQKPATSPIPQRAPKKSTGIQISIKQTKDDEEGTINKALRREVLAYTTDGIAQSLERAGEIAQHTNADNNSLPRACDYPIALTGPNNSSLQAFTMHIKFNEELLYGRKSNASTHSLNSDNNNNNNDDNDNNNNDNKNDDSNNNNGNDNNNIDENTPRGTGNGKQHLLAKTRTQQSSIGVLSGMDGNTNTNNSSSSKKSGKNNVIKRQKSESRSQAQVKRSREFVDYAPLVFRFIRQRVLGMPDEEYVKSIIPSTKEAQKDVLDAKYGEGKSGAFFYFTHDSKFLVKTITKAETQFFLSILRPYTEYLNDNPDVVANRFLGLHSCQMYGLRFYFVVMQNIFLANLQPHEKYDLKGSWVDRSTNHGIASGKIMKDLDLKKYIILSRSNKERLLDQMEKDTRFLSKLNIMDYSLLLGIYYMKIAHNAPQGVYPRGRGLSYDAKERKDDERRSSSKALLTSYAGGVRAQVIEGPGIYYMGIIDILQNYTLKKKAEHYAKRYILRKDGGGISCIDPITYQKRFMNYMRKIIVDDEQFYSEQAVNMDQFVSQTLYVYPGDDAVETNMKQMRMSFAGGKGGGSPGLPGLAQGQILAPNGAIRNNNNNGNGSSGLGVPMITDENDNTNNNNNNDEIDSKNSASSTPIVGDAVIEMDKIRNENKENMNNENNYKTNKKGGGNNDKNIRYTEKNSKDNNNNNNNNKNNKGKSNSNTGNANVKKGKGVNSNTNSNGSTKTTVKFADSSNNNNNNNNGTTNVKDLNVKLSPANGRGGGGASSEAQTPVESHSRTNPPMRGTSHSVTGTGVTMSGSDGSDNDVDESAQPLSAQVNQNNRILVTKHNDTGNSNSNNNNNINNNSGGNNNNFAASDLLGDTLHKQLSGGGASALSVSPAAPQIEESNDQLHEPIEPSVTATSMGGVFSHSYGDTAARRSELGIVSSFTNLKNQGGSGFLGGIGSTDVEKSEAQGGPLGNQNGHKTMLSGSIIPPQEARVSEYFTQGRDGRGMSVITDDGRVSVTDFGHELPMATDEHDTLRSRSDVNNQFDDGKESMNNNNSNNSNHNNNNNKMSNNNSNYIQTNMKTGNSSNTMMQYNSVTPEPANHGNDDDDDETTNTMNDVAITPNVSTTAHVNVNINGNEKDFVDTPKHVD